MDRRQALAGGRTLPERATGAALFADISGFTPLTKALTDELGKRAGAEEVLRHINPIYTALIAVLHRFGGSVIGFAGDAITCWLDDEQGPAAPRGAACALEMQAVMDSFTTHYTPGGRPVTLGIKIAVAYGPVRRFLVGDPAERLVEALAGRTLTDMAEAEQRANTGEVVLTRRAVELLDEQATVAEWRGDFGLVSGLTQPVADCAWPPLADDAIDESTLHNWILRPVYEQLRAGAQFLGDLRPVSPLFIRFSGIDYDEDDQAGEKLDAFIRRVQTIMDQWQGQIIQLTIGDKGAYLYVAFGAPVAHEDDSRRALAAALALQALPAELGFLEPLQIGVTQGEVWTGACGADSRYTYAVMGNEVNVSARLMAKAKPGETWVLARLASIPHFEFDYLGDFEYKGFAEPVATYRLVGQTVVKRVFDNQMVGREAEMAALRAFTRPLFDTRRGGVAVINGEAGIGKSHLLYALQQALGPEVTWLMGQSDAILQQAFEPFVYFLKSYFRQAAGVSDGDNKAAFEKRLGELLESTAVSPELASELQRTHSCLGALLGLRWPDSLYEQLDSDGRYNNTLIALTVLLQAECQRQPVVLGLEDGHWFDEASLALLGRLGEQTAEYPLLILITSRYQDDGSRVPFPFGAETAALQVDLKTLSPAALYLLAEDILERPIDDHLHQLLVDKSQANPFYAQQILYYLKENGLLSPIDKQGRQLFCITADSFNLPTTLNTLLIARLDRLPPDLKEVVQTASVLGREFEARLLARMINRELGKELERGEEEQIWSLLRALNYIFKHILLRDAAYDMLLRSRLRQLHQLAARAYEELYREDLRPYYTDLAYHYGQAQVADKEFHYSLAAGKEIANQFANQEAIKYFSRALELAPQLAIDSEMLVQIYLQRGRVWELLMEHDKAYASYLEMGTLSEKRGDKSLAMAGLVARTILFSTITPYYDHHQGHSLAAEALAMADELDDKVAKVRILWSLMLANSLGTMNLEKGVVYGEQAVAAARELELQDQLGISLNDLGRTLGWYGRVADGRARMLEARSILEKLKHTQVMDNYHGYGQLCLFSGDYDEGYQSVTMATELATQLNNIYSWTIGSWWKAMIELERGNWGQSLAIYADLLANPIEPIDFYYGILGNCSDVHLAVGLTDEQTLAAVMDETENGLKLNPLFKVWFMANLTRIHVVRGDLDTAVQTLQWSGVDPDKDAFSSFASSAFLADVELAFALGDTAVAERKVDRTIEYLETAGQRWWLLDLYFIKAKIQQGKGQTEASKATLIKALAAASPSEKRMRWQLLALLAELARQEGNLDEAEQWDKEAQEVVDYLLVSLEKPEWQEAFLERKRSLFPQ